MSKRNRTKNADLELEGSKAAKAAWSFASFLGRKTAKLTRDAVMLARPLAKKEKFDILKVKEHLSESEFARLSRLVKQGKAEIKLEKKEWSFLISGKNLIPSIKFIKPDKRKFNLDYDVELKEQVWLEELDKKLRNKFLEQTFNDFAPRAWTTVPQFIASNLVGMADIKNAVALQLFSKEAIHILLIGDPGTGKTDILRAGADISPISAYGLGSGTSGAGLSITASGNQVSPGLLPMAHNGLCAIDELNLMKKEDYASMYNAMEKGFVTYDKAGKHFKFDALVKILATANPKDDKFENYSIEQIKKQLPFDSALLSRFHLIFFVKQMSLEGFSKIAEKIINQDKVEMNKDDVEFLKKYIKYTYDLEIKLPDNLAVKIKDFVTDLKAKEAQLPFEITPRLVVGLMRMAKASARMEARTKIEAKDLERVFEVVNSAIRI
ncbi:MAG: ATP-binding protein [DPANN group archaeon]|nr:ATP-binding protein [DPANN group archaeon]